jgi:hypothetical protein
MVVVFDRNLLLTCCPRLDRVGTLAGMVRAHKSTVCSLFRSSVIDSTLQSSSGFDLGFLHCSRIVKSLQLVNRQLEKW